MIIKNGQVALPGCDRAQTLDIRVQDGQIRELGADLSGDDALLDAAGMLVLPGGIDPHVHMNDPGYTHHEDFYHGTCAAASGGITTVIDMPCTSVPPVTTQAHFTHKLEAIAPKAVVDYGLFGGVSAQALDEYGTAGMASLAPDVLGFKVYLISGMETFERLDHFRLRRVLACAASLRKPVLIHAEDYDYVQAATTAIAPAGDGPGAYYRSRPETAEMLAALAVAQLAKETRADLHVVHVATADAARHLAAHGATAETAPHYLAFTLADFCRIGAPLKVTPPVKEADNREALWALLADGTLSFVASDHAPCGAEEKATGSIWTDYSGIPGTGTLLPYLFSEGYLKGRLTLGRLVEVTSAGAAKRYGLADRKGSIAVGWDADLALIDPNAQWTVHGASFLSKGKVTPFEGMVLQGRVAKTIVRGRVVYDFRDGIQDVAGYGRLLRAWV
ncbi:MAG: amidohydrolase family protein [Anaerolineae bacterium]|nr:amidohydrolase family protein [Anaerolineae bacterium]